MIDMFVVSGTDKFVCQSCGETLLPLSIGKQRCICGQGWKVSPSIGNPFALMNLKKTGHSKQTGDPYYYSGCLVEVSK